MSGHLAQMHIQNLEYANKDRIQTIQTKAVVNMA